MVNGVYPEHPVNYSGCKRLGEILFFLLFIALVPGFPPCVHQETTTNGHDHIDPNFMPHPLKRWQITEFDERHSKKDEDCPHRNGTQNSIKKHLMLIDVGDSKKLENHDEDKKV